MFDNFITVLEVIKAPIVTIGVAFIGFYKVGTELRGKLEYDRQILFDQYYIKGLLDTKKKMIDSMSDLIILYHQWLENPEVDESDDQRDRLLKIGSDLEFAHREASTYLGNSKLSSFIWRYVITYIRHNMKYIEGEPDSDLIVKEKAFLYQNANYRYKQLLSYFETKELNLREGAKTSRKEKNRILVLDEKIEDGYIASEHWYNNILKGTYNIGSDRINDYVLESLVDKIEADCSQGSRRVNGS